MPIKWGGLAALILALGIFWWWPTPQERFCKEMNTLVKSLNEGRGDEIRQRISQDLVVWIEDQGLTVDQAVVGLRRLDADQGVLYRFDGLVAWRDSDHAEARFTRSGPRGNFEKRRSILVPWVRGKEGWQAVSRFLDGREWMTPEEAATILE